ncbi:hypothetical protein P3342_011688 [Pyrenophora teres f. teres]|uniref:MARVEL domain-containing protein n=2 Tax=Pyrenophora teres f. teres TaxID=97479 RepID=E3RPN1_PYRTT|nr:hypothetical protein PTT_10616 [Pyrenophora teres f. teres 0-1]KAE8825019.1 hypothetical protein PTNB85_09783 [Pyrenophora teres f. teres]CAA9965683.1 hypothetical protein PTMSG1_09042 [Pyrenophora teres f. maculata]KAE8831545.1 hypothetical protein HRS9139_05787 [Pyrenophora teres f. teres]KAE8835718.1 hypothetical protein HRS9122_07988 [Pyrenophora teres f. teres]
MPETQDERPLLSKHAVAILLHAVRILLALIILCLDTYAIHFSGDLAMVYSLILAISTIFVCVYSIACMRFFRNYYNFNIQIGLQWSFMFFWLVNLGLVATRAHQWQRSKCTDLTVLEYSMHCPGVGAEGGLHVLQNGGTTAVKTYTGALIAGAILAAFQVIFWAIMTALFIRSTRKLTEILPCPHSPTIQMQTSTTHVELPSNPLPPPQPRRMEAWESPIVEAPRLVPQPILPDSDEEDDVSTGPTSSITAQDGDAGANRAGHVVAEYVAQQAVEPGFDPYVGHLPLRQTPLRYWHPPPCEEDGAWEWDGRGSVRMVGIPKGDDGR